MNGERCFTTVPMKEWEDCSYPSQVSDSAKPVEVSAACKEELTSGLMKGGLLSLFSLGCSLGGELH